MSQDKVDTTQFGESSGIQKATDPNHQSASKIKMPKRRELKTVRDAFYLFFENVCIKGLWETYVPEFASVRVFWCLVMITVFYFIGIQSKSVVRKFRNQKPEYGTYVFSETPMSVPFPNISICSPHMIDQEKLKQNLLIPKRNFDTLIKHGYLELMFDFVGRLLLFYRTKDAAALVNYPQIVQDVGARVLDATIKMAGGYPELLGKVVLPCREMLSECSYQGQAFDCCSAAQFVIAESGQCFYIQIPPELNYLPQGPQDSSQHPETNGLSFTVNVNPKMVLQSDGLVTDGYYVYIGSEPWTLTVPVPIPINADAKILLSEPRRIREISNCVSNHEKPTLRYFDYYDQYGYRCWAENTINLHRHYVGCTVPTSTYFPGNGSMCGGTQLLMLVRMTSGIDDLFARRRYRYSYEYEELLSETLSLKTCRPLCYRYVYGVRSSSYNYVQYSKRSQSIKENRSWSRIRIMFSSDDYIVTEEYPPYSIMVVFNQVRRVLMWWARISLTSLIQVFVYGLVIIWVFFYLRFKKRQNHPMPQGGQPNQLGSSAGNTVEDDKTDQHYHNKAAINYKGKFSLLPLKRGSRVAPLAADIEMHQSQGGTSGLGNDAGIVNENRRKLSALIYDGDQDPTIGYTIA